MERKGEGSTCESQIEIVPSVSATQTNKVLGMNNIDVIGFPLGSGAVISFRVCKQKLVKKKGGGRGGEGHGKKNCAHNINTKVHYARGTTNILSTPHPPPPPRPLFFIPFLNKRDATKTCLGRMEPLCNMQ